ncbi:hypothetical protein D3C84_883420 [compost metagenome]
MPGRARQVDVQQHGLGQSQQRQHRKGRAPTQGVADQGTDRNAEHRGAHYAEADLGNGPAGIGRADDVDCRFTGQGPEHRQTQGRDQARHAHHIEVVGHGRQGVGRGEHQQNADEQALALEARRPGGEEWAEASHGEGEQGHQQARLGHADLKVAGNARQQADDDELGGQYSEAGRSQQQNRQ